MPRWTIEFDKRAAKEFSKLNKDIQRRIVLFLKEKVSDNPRNHGKALVGSLKGLWRYRIGDYRIICRIEDDRCVVLVVAIGHRKDIYD